MQKSKYTIESWQADKDKSVSKARQMIQSMISNNGIDLDQKAQATHEEVTACMDCLACANCCKTTVTTFTQEDVNRASKFLNMSKKAFINKYLISDMGEYTTIHTPCPFLNTDNTCAIYEVRPLACASFPHTHRKNFVSRREGHAHNYVVCPITYHVLNAMGEKEK